MMVELHDIVGEATSDQGQHSSSLEEEWFNFLVTMLGCVDNKNVEACSISLIPEQLRKSKPEAYMPQVVSIGPLHRGTRADLLYMEEIKWRCMLYLLHRSKQQNPMQVLKNCGKAMLKLDEIVRASYNVDDVRFNRNDLAKIMLLDGCFLLELLISETSETNKLLHCSLDGPSPGGGVIKREKVLSDLTMLENQIPLVVLDKLSSTLFPEINDEVRVQWIHNHALSIMGYNYNTLDSRFSELKAFHFVELVHSFVDKEKNEIQQKEAKDRKNICMDSGEEKKISHRKPKLQRCATRLEAGGVTIKPSDMASRFDLKVTFNDGKLEIPQLHITETTEAKWRNLIAWELNRVTLEKQRGKEDKISCQFICYAWFIQSLICCVHDVKLLKDRKVILVQELDDNEKKGKIIGDEDLMNLFRSMTEGVPEAEINMDSWLGYVIQKLNKYPIVDRSTATSRIVVDRGREKCKIVWHVMRCFVTWIWYQLRGAYRELRLHHIPTGWKLIAVLAAASGLALTAIQTHFSIHVR